MIKDNVMIKVQGLGKCFKIYPRQWDRMREWLSFGDSVYHQDFWALRDISFEVRRGECLGIIGQNGAGKSTLLKILSKALYHTKGQYDIKGRILSLLELGTGFNQELTGRQNILNSARLLGFPMDYLTAERMRQIEEFADIAEFFDRPVRVYSSGMYVRLAFSMFIFMEPDVFIIDEALSVGDIFFQQKCFSKIHDLLKVGTTIVFVSHDLQAVQNLSNRAILLEHGKILFIGPPEEAVSRYYATLGQNILPYQSGRSSNTFENIYEYHPIMEPSEIIAHSILNGKSRHGNGEMEIVAARVTDKSGRDTFSVSIMEEFRFYLLVRAATNMHDPSVSIEIFDRFKNLVFSSSTRHMGVRLPVLSPGEERVIGFKINMSVQPGQYTFSLVCGRPAHGSNPNLGCVADRHDSLGPLSVIFDYDSGLAPFNGIAKLPMEII